MSAPPLRARAATLGAAFDLIAAYEAPAGFFFERGGLGLSARGAAERVLVSAGAEQIARSSPAVRAAFAAIGSVDGALPVATGAFPFDGSRHDAHLVVGDRSVCRGTIGETTQVVVERPGIEHTRALQHWAGRSVPHSAFEPIQLHPVPDRETYMDAVARAVSAIRGGNLRKVVLTRSLDVDAERELDAKQLLWRLRAVDPDCYAFAVPIEPRAVLVGASPELLVARRGSEVRSNPLAGSAPRSGDPEEDRANADALRSSSKNRIEHQVVVDAVADALVPICERLEFDPEPVLLGTANVWHLSTRFRGHLRDPAPDVLEILATLHPTPAVCGTPRDLALAEIEHLEPFDRGHYAGPVGWVDANGDGDWAIALRCAEISGSSARLFAGAGIVADSGPTLELDETERKFRALLDALRWS
jgi:isochorismate synthase